MELWKTFSNYFVHTEFHDFMVSHSRILDNNDITSIADSAFYGSEIGKLYVLLNVENFPETF